MTSPDLTSSSEKWVPRGSPSLLSNHQLIQTPYLPVKCQLDLIPKGFISLLQQFRAEERGGGGGGGIPRKCPSGKALGKEELSSPEASVSSPEPAVTRAASQSQATPVLSPSRLLSDTWGAGWGKLGPPSSFHKGQEAQRNQTPSICPARAEGGTNLPPIQGCPWLPSSSFRVAFDNPFIQGDHIV